MSTPNAGERAKAYRLRAKTRKGETIEPADAAWLSDYEERQRQRNGSFGASASERVVHVEERSAAVGTGEASQAAAAAALAREEGRRLDYLVRGGMDALVSACKLYESMCAAMLARTQALEEVHLSMLDAVREQYLARTQAEVDALQQGEGEGINHPMVQQIIAAVLQRLQGGQKPPT